VELDDAPGPRFSLAPAHNFELPRSPNRLLSPAHSIHGSHMPLLTLSHSRRALTRRAFLAAVSLTLAAFATPAFAEKKPAGTVSTDELMAPDALPDVMQGKADAPVTIIEYASMTCSHCAAFHLEVFPALKKNYIDTGKVKFALREFPLDPLATAAFMLTRVLDDKRDAAVDLLFAQQKNWAFTDKPLDGLANVLKQAGLGQEKFEATLKDKELFDKVAKVRDRAAEKLGVSSTPTFFINGEKYTGEIGIADFDKIIAAKAK
jgi:protein-disulfide isomerase